MRIEYLLIYCLLAMPITPVYAEDDDSDNDERTLVDRAARTSGRGLGRPISGYLFRKMGEPGFYLSKYFNYRRQTSKPACTTSEKLSHYANMLVLAGDVVTHAYQFYNSKKLKSKYKDRLENINEFVDERKENNQDVFEDDGNKLDVQIHAFDYFNDQREYELKRLKLLRYFKYPALAMSSTATVMNMAEIGNEITDPTALARYKKCMAGKSKDKAKTEAEIEALTTKEQVDNHFIKERYKGQIDNTKGSDSKKFANRKKRIDKWAEKWYLKPFAWMLGGLSSADSWYRKNLSTYKKGMNTVDYAQDTGVSLSPDELLKIHGDAQANGYAEDMIVDLITDAIDKWQDKEPAEVRKRLNEQMKKEGHKKKKNPFMKIVTGLGLDEMAIRYGVRSVILPQLEITHQSMTTGVGRGLVYGYNIYVTYREVDRLEKDIKYTKEEIRFLEKRKSQLEEKLSFSIDEIKFINFVFNHVMNRLIPSAHASIPKSLSKFEPLGPICMNLDNDPSFRCFQRKSLNPFNNDLYVGHNQETKKFMRDLLSKNYSFKMVNGVTRGLAPIQKIDYERSKKEFYKMEQLYSKMLKRLPVDKRKILLQQEKYNSKMDQLSMPLHPIVMDHYIKNYNKGLTREARSDVLNNLENLTNKPITTTPKDPLTASVNTNAINESSKPIEYKDYNFKTLHKKNKNSLWDIISNRYRKSELY